MGYEQKQKGLAGTNDRLHPEYPFLKSEVVYAVREQMAIKPNDVVCRRIPLSFLDIKVAEEILPEVVEIMAKELGWSSQQKSDELKAAKDNLKFMF